MHRLSRVLHPDRSANPGAAAAFARVAESHAQLQEEEYRAEMALTVAQAEAELCEATVPARTGDTEEMRLRERVTCILLELEYAAMRQDDELEADAPDTPAAAATAGGGGGAKQKGGRRRRARDEAKAQQGVFVRPDDWRTVTRHVFVANTGPKFGVSPEQLQEALSEFGSVERVTVVKPTLPYAKHILSRLVLKSLEPLQTTATRECPR